ncbi:hypothetical protein K8S19_10665 [bacterium]|nr:hypothetical protein [bacterium]
MELGKILYYSASILLWVFLAVMAWAALRSGFPKWLREHEQAMLVLLGTNQMPANPEKTLRRFYLFLGGGWTWLLIWSWWLMPVVKDFFFREVSNPAALQISRISSGIVLFAYAGVGFFWIGKAVTIWFKEIYNHQEKEIVRK